MYSTTECIVKCSVVFLVREMRGLTIGACRSCSNSALLL